ncbi:MAG: hypothetical protein EPN47_04560 [Acidobacteria bacterium]|nr:MAG: hypothetical protein EPN47_04560 [Acidobacteriota bacterium]
MPLFSYLSLFGSFGTLLCCALPSLLVLLGLGATMASFLSALPFLETMSRYKPWTFSISGVLIAADWIYLYWLAPRLRARSGTGEVCPVDGPSACSTADRVSRVTLWVATGIYAVGFFTAFILGPLLWKFGS